MNTILHEHTPEIIQIAAANDAECSTGYAMFLGNIEAARNGKDIPYPGADVDYSALVDKAPPIISGEDDALRNTYLVDLRENLPAVMEMFGKGDFDGIRKLMLEVAAKRDEDTGEGNSDE